MRLRPLRTRLTLAPAGGIVALGNDGSAAGRGSPGRCTRHRCCGAFSSGRGSRKRPSGRPAVAPGSERRSMATQVLTMDRDVAAAVGAFDGLPIMEQPVLHGMGWLPDRPDCRDYGADHEVVRPALEQVAAPTINGGADPAELDP